METSALVHWPRYDGARWLFFFFTRGDQTDWVGRGGRGVELQRATPTPPPPTQQLALCPFTIDWNQMKDVYVCVCVDGGGGGRGGRSKPTRN